MDTSLPTITLDHNPERFDQHTYFTDLQLSGHTHNGQIFPDNIILHYYYQNSYGLSIIEPLSSCICWIWFMGIPI